MSALYSGRRGSGSLRAFVWLPRWPIALAAVLVSAALLYVRPLIRLASLDPRRPLRDPYHNAANFILKDSYVGHDFLQHWQWETMDDPTHGRVNFVDQPTALATNLSFVSDDKFVMRADSLSVVPPNARGRSSVRITSLAAYDESVVVLDIAHMPEGCSTWPAFWSLSQKGPWPHGGEIDIIEGVNLDRQNIASLHTTPSCTMGTQRWMTGNVISTNCDANINYNQGCGVAFDKPASYGSEFNAAGGGFFAIARIRSSDPAVRIWFWSRGDPAVPPEIREPPSYPTVPGLGAFPGPAIYPTPFWGVPQAEFPLADQCDYASHFDPHAFVFDLTLCGDWAGSDYPTSGCPGDCVDFVNNNPQAFENAYWEINALHVYTPP